MVIFSLTVAGRSIQDKAMRCSDVLILIMTERFQMVSLLKLATVTEEGVRFLSPHDGTPM